MHHVDIINKLIKKFGLKSYLEVGLHDANLCFNHIEVADKISVDLNPLARPTFAVSSDEFFSGNTRKFGLIFIDGDHSHEQSYRDIVNALDCLDEVGYVVVHDCLPTSDAMQQVPRIQLEWCGRVWESILKLRILRTDAEVFTVNTDYGCAVIKKGYSWAIKTNLPLTYDNFKNNKKSWLNLISEDQFEKWLKRT